MHIFEEEFVADVDKYLDIALTEKVYIMMKNGRIAILSKTDESQSDLIDTLGTPFSSCDDDEDVDWPR